MQNSDHRYSASNEAFLSGSPLHSVPLERALESAGCYSTCYSTSRLEALEKDSTAAQPLYFYEIQFVTAQLNSGHSPKQAGCRTRDPLVIHYITTSIALASSHHHDPLLTLQLPFKSIASWQRHPIAYLHFVPSPTLHPPNFLLSRLKASPRNHGRPDADGVSGHVGEFPSAPQSQPSHTAIHLDAASVANQSPLSVTLACIAATAGRTNPQ